MEGISAIKEEKRVTLKAFLGGKMFAKASFDTVACLESMTHVTPLTNTKPLIVAK